MMTNKMQIFDLFIYTQSALCFSGDVFVHHREHLTVFTASDIPPMLLPAGVMDEMGIQSSAPDDGRKHRPKHVELIDYK